MIKLIKGECLAEMDKLIAEGITVDAIITDPPYGIMAGIKARGYHKKLDWDIELDISDMFERCNKLLRTNGALVLFGQEPYTSKIITKAHGNLPFSYRMTWLKNSFGNAMACKKAPVSYTEDISVFFKKYDTEAQHPLRNYAKRIRELIGLNKNTINEELGHMGSVTFLFYAGTLQFTLCTEKTYNELIERYGIDKFEGFMSFKELTEIHDAFKYKTRRCFNLPEGKNVNGNVLEYKKDTGLHHPTQKPVALMEDLIRTYTNEGDTVLDFTMGSGSTGVACGNTDRNFIGIEISDEYFSTAQKRNKRSRSR